MSGRSRLQAALAAKDQVWGGWVVGPTAIGPEEYARCGYDYVGFDTQHGYLDDADVAGLLRRLEHVPIGTAVRLPSAAPAWLMLRRKVARSWRPWLRFSSSAPLNRPRRNP